jgi:hypothetical protein
LVPISIEHHFNSKKVFDASNKLIDTLSGLIDLSFAAAVRSLTSNAWRVLVMRRLSAHPLNEFRQEESNACNGSSFDVRSCFFGDADFE